MNENILNAIVKIVVNPITVNIFYPFKIMNERPTTGSGIAISNDSETITILTCAHVVDNVAKLFVVLSNKNKVPATVLGICFDKDVAFIQIKKQDIKEANKDSDNEITSIDIESEENIAQNIKQGDSLYAVGYPLGEENLILTSGVFSAFKKNYLQVDTPVNPGNSGGPLINANKIVGIVSSKIPNDVASNIAYCIPINQIVDLYQQIKAKTEIPYIIHEFKLGVSFMDTNPLIYSHIFNNMIKNGYLIKKIHNTSYLSNKIPDLSLITKVNDREVDGYGYINTSNIKFMNKKTHITDYMALAKIGDKIKLEFLRPDLEKQIVEITFENKHLYKIRRLYFPYDKLDYELFAGMVITPLTLNHIIESGDNITDYNQYLINKYINPDFRDTDVIFVSAILQGSIVSDIDIFDNGEIITHVNDQEIKSESEPILDVFRRMIITNLEKSKILKFTSITGKFITLNIDDVLELEPELSEMHNYKITDFNKSLLKPTISIEDTSKQAEEQQQIMDPSIPPAIREILLGKLNDIREKQNTSESSNVNQQILQQIKTFIDDLNSSRLNPKLKGQSGGIINNFDNKFKTYKSKQDNDTNIIEKDEKNKYKDINLKYKLKKDYRN